MHCSLDSPAKVRDSTRGVTFSINIWNIKLTKSTNRTKGLHNIGCVYAYAYARKSIYHIRCMAAIDVISAAIATFTSLTSNNEIRKEKTAPYSRSLFHLAHTIILSTTFRKSNSLLLFIICITNSKAIIIAEHIHRKYIAAGTNVYGIYTRHTHTHNSVMRNRMVSPYIFIIKYTIDQKICPEKFI